MPRAKNTSLMSLAIMSLLDERPMHPYEIASLMKERGITYSIKLDVGNLYAAMNSLLSEGLIAVKEIRREGNLPERTVYELTRNGVESCRALLRDILREPKKEYPRFIAGLSFIVHLEPGEVAELLAARISELRLRMGREQAETDAARSGGVDEIYLLEAQYSLRLLEAELAWTQELRESILAGKLTKTTATGIQWRVLSGSSDVH